MKYLFFFVHPAKFHFLRVSINQLIAAGHDVEILITSKEILEDLIKEEGWKYKNIFPKGRRISFLHTYLSAAVNTFRTIYRLLKHTWGMKYDLFVTDDLLTFVGRLKKTLSIFITDDDLGAVPESWILAASANYILAPSMCDMKRYEYKKIGYLGYKALAHLHPNHFEPEKAKVNGHLLNGKPYFFLRLVSPTSTHDVGKAGIDDETLMKLVERLEPRGHIMINSQRPLPSGLEKYAGDFKKKNVAHYLSFANMFISDSTTMCAEAAVLGTPAIEFDDWFSDFAQYHEFNGKYGLIHGFSPSDQQGMFNKIDEFLNNKELKKDFENRRNRMLSEKIDVSSFMIWLFENFPQSAEKILKDSSYQAKFR